MQEVSSFLPLVVMSLVWGIVLFYLGVKKGYTWPFLLWAWIPLFNMLAFPLFIGLPDLKLHKKIDKLLEEYKIH